MNSAKVIISKTKHAAKRSQLSCFARNHSTSIDRVALHLRRAAVAGVGHGLAILSAEHSARGGEAASGLILTRDEVRRLLAGCSGEASTGLRNRALITVMYRGGLRVAESIGLPTTAVDRDSGIIRVSRSNNRMIALDPSSCRILDAWIARRRDLKIAWQGPSPLFCTLRGGRLNPSYVRALFSRLAAKAGIAKRVSAEALRRTLAAELAREGVPIGLIQAQLGHQSTSTTERFLNRVASQDLVEVMRKRHNWLS
jgi:integrase/recombinase XerC